VLSVNGRLTSNVACFPSDGGAGGTFSPSGVTFVAGVAPASVSFTYTPASLGAKTITITNDGGLSGPAPFAFNAIAPPSIVGQYRTSQTNQYLFQTCGARSEPPRVPGASLTFPRDQYGPTGYYVDANCGWAWGQVGGDWIDKNGVLYGATNWISTTVPAIGVQSIDVTEMTQFCQVNDRWMAFLVKASASVTITGVFGTAPFPTITVTYDNDEVEVLECRLTARVPTTDTINTTFNFGNNVFGHSNTTEASYATPIVMEFERPTRAVVSATLALPITAKTGTPTLTINILSPVVDDSPVEIGAAYDYSTLDAGLSADPDMLIVHRYVDGTVLNDFRQLTFPPGMIVTGQNPNISQANMDPAIYETGPQDLLKFPHVAQGKWLGLLDVNSGGSRGRFELVSSSYTGHGFEPLAPGMGAMLIHMDKDTGTDGLPVHDGSIVTAGGTVAANARMFLPEPEFGLCDDLHVRHYFRLASVGPYSPSIVDRFNVHRSVGGTGVWSSCAGKCGIAAAHESFRGGVSATSGGMFGFQGRFGFGDCDEQQGGPSEAGWRFGFHAFDFQSNNPPGFQYSGWAANGRANLGHPGGLGGVLYANRWYCLDWRMKLNGITDAFPGYSDTSGLIQVRLDGRLVWDEQGMVFRCGPVYSGFRTHVTQTAFGPDQHSQVAVFGVGSGARGYAGVIVRQRGTIGNSGSTANNWMQGYIAFLSPVSAGVVKVTLLRRQTYNVFTTVLNTMTTTWADGDVLRLEASGTGPTNLFVRKNGVLLFSYTDTADLNVNVGYDMRVGTRVGVFGTSNDQTHGFFIGPWQGGDSSGFLADNWAYSDGLMTQAAPSANWLHPDEVGVGRITSGMLWFPRAGDSLVFHNPSIRTLPARDLGFKNLWFNWFHGGQERNTVDRRMFITGLVAGKRYIGPMKLT
jgi:hypothetical protein